MKCLNDTEVEDLKDVECLFMQVVDDMRANFTSADEKALEPLNTRMETDTR